MDKKFEPVDLTIYLVLVVLMALLAMCSARADDGHGHDHHDSGGDVDVTTGDVITGDTSLSGGDMIGGDTNVSTGGNKTFAFSHSLGDVDINEGQNCLGSEAWGSFIISRQTNELNPWCAALFYELNGKHDFAAKMRCDIKEIRRKYSSDDECWRDQDLTPREGYGGPDPDEITDTFEDIEEAHDKEIQQVQTAQASIVDRLDYLTQKIEEAPAKQTVQAPAKREDLLSQQEKLDILGLLSYKGGDEDE